MIVFIGMLIVCTIALGKHEYLDSIYSKQRARFKSWLSSHIESKYIESGLKYDFQNLVDLYTLWIFLGLPIVLGYALILANAFVLSGALLITYIPISLIRIVASGRKDHLFALLPNELDLLSMIMSAGNDLYGALITLCQDKESNILRQEFQRVIKTMDVGVSRTEAFQLLYERNRISAFENLANAIETSEVYGTSISFVFKEQAVQIRQELFQHFELRAQKAPFKMLVPLLGLIFPVTLILILGPIMIDLLALVSN
ncbi:MAG: type II secretion system F family protein [Bdellovibrionales bacterium]|nr:type II secretion system F family protein [Bdellovibrionales bacterium]